MAAPKALFALEEQEFPHAGSVLEVIGKGFRIA
jgi:hypothetical protein